MSAQVASSQRDPFFDNARFLLVSLVVLGHFLSPLRGDSDLVYSINNFLSLFRMPALIFVTGYFAKRFQKDGHIENVFIKLLVPFIIFQFLFAHYYAFLYGREVSFDILRPQYTLWFLLALFVWHVKLFAYSRLKHPLTVSICVALAVGYSDGAGHYAAFHRIFVFFPFFLMGFYAKGEHIERLKSVRGWVPVVILVFGWLLFDYLISNDFARNLVLGNRSYSRMGITDWYAFAYRGFIMGFSVVVGAAFLVLVPSRKTWFTRLGGRSAYIYILHGAIVRTAYEYGLKDYFDGYTLYVALVLLTMFVVLALSSNAVVNISRPLVEGTIVTWVKKATAPFYVRLKALFGFFVDRYLKSWFVRVK